MKRVQVLLADDNSELLEMVKDILAPSFDVVGLVSDGQALVEQAGRLNPDVIIADITMPFLDGIAAVAKLKKLENHARIIFLTVHEDPDFLQACMDVGALGYVLKARLVSDLVASIHAALAGRVFVSPPLVWGQLEGR